MRNNQDLESLERDAYQAAYSDGIVDIYVGLSLLWIGAAWIWLPDLAGVAGVIPAVFIVPMLASRKRIVEPRVGYVQWTAPRRSWEQRNLFAVLAAGVLLFALGVGAFFAFNSSSVDNDLVGTIMPGLLAWLLAAIAIVLGFLMQAGRMFWYAAALAVGGALAAWQDANPGWPLLGAGVVITATGVVMLVRFLHDNPLPEDA